MWDALSDVSIHAEGFYAILVCFISIIKSISNDEALHHFCIFITSIEAMKTPSIAHAAASALKKRANALHNIRFIAVCL